MISMPECRELIIIQIYAIRMPMQVGAGQSIQEQPARQVHPSTFVSDSTHSLSTNSQYSTPTHGYNHVTTYVLTQRPRNKDCTPSFPRVGDYLCSLPLLCTFFNVQLYLSYYKIHAA